MKFKNKLININNQSKEFNQYKCEDFHSIEEINRPFWVDYEIDFMKFGLYMNIDFYKIYIDHYNPQNIKQNFNKLQFFLQKTEKYIEFLTDQGSFLLDCNGKNLEFKKLKYIDKPISKKNNLLIDKSIFKSEIVLSQIPYYHCYNEIIIKYYGRDNHNCNNKCNRIKNNNSIKLAIEGKIMNDEFEPNNFYFLVDNLLDIDNSIIAEELDWFLSVLK
jgi:hypothetical protein